MKETNPKPVGSGAYVVKTTSDASYTFTANPNYRDGAPPITDVQYLGLDSNQSGQDMLTTGQIDWTGMFVANPDTVTGDWRDRHHEPAAGPDRRSSPARTRPRAARAPRPTSAVRQALNVAIDRPAAGGEGVGRPGRQGQPGLRAAAPRPAVARATRASPPARRAANAAQAGQILEAAGYTKDAKGFYAKDGKEIDLDLFSPDGWTDYNDAAKLIAEEAGKAGIKVTARTVSEAEYWTPVTNGDFQLAMYGLTQSLVADPFSNYDQYFFGKSTAKVGDAPTRGQNYSRYSNPMVDAAVEAAGATNDAAAKKAEYAKIQAQIAKDLPYIPVVLNASQAFFNTKGFTGWPTDDNLYADPLPYLSVAPAIVLLHLKPVS